MCWQKAHHKLGDRRRVQRRVECPSGSSLGEMTSRAEKRKASKRPLRKHGVQRDSPCWSGASRRAPSSHVRTARNRNIRHPESRFTPDRARNICVRAQCPQRNSQENELYIILILPEILYKSRESRMQPHKTTNRYPRTIAPLNSCPRPLPRGTGRCFARADGVRCS